MSLLIPSECDFEDAHENPQTETLYREALEQLRQKNPHDFKWNFETVPGFFVQADEATDDLAFRYTDSQMGRKLEWNQISAKLAELNENAEPNVSYKLIICARHGQGFHNYIVDKYGVPAWNEKWRTLTTDGEVTYAPDPMLTDIGLKQAQENHVAWEKEVLQHSAPLPSKYYASPLQRSCWTHKITWDGLKPAEKKTVIVENLRETIGGNLCDKRSTRTEIEQRFGPHGFQCEPSFAEEDTLFSPRRETDVEHAVRINRFCQQLFADDWDDSTGVVDKAKAVEHSFISTTTHAGSIRLFIVVFGHRRFTISTGGMIPIVVKGTRL